MGPEIVPWEDLDVQNLNLTSKIDKSGTRTPKIRKNRSGTIILVFRVVVYFSIVNFFGCLS